MDRPHGKNPIFMAHHSQYPSLKANLVNTQFKRLNQDVVDLNFEREDLASCQMLKYILNTLTSVKNPSLDISHPTRPLLLMKTSSLLMLRLEFIDQVHLFKDPKIWIL